MISEYQLKHEGLSVLLRFNADETWINHADLMDRISKIVQLAECCESFSLAIIKTETPDD